MASVSVASIQAEVSKAYGINYKLLNIDIGEILKNSSLKTPPLDVAFSAVEIGELKSFALVPNLETFHFDDDLADPNLPDRLIERNIEEANFYLQICGNLRKDFHDLAKLYIDTALRAEEFFRIDAIHFQEVVSGLYDLPYLEATIERGALDKACQILDAQIARINKARENGEFMSAAGFQKFTDDNGALARAMASKNNDEIRDLQRSVTSHRNEFDSISWDYSRSTSQAAMEQARGRHEISKRREQYLDKDRVYRANRASVSRDIAYRQLFEHIRPGSIVNYSERLSNVITLFDSSLKKLCARVIAIREATPVLYGTALPPVIVLNGSLLDGLSAWVLEAQEKLSSRYRREQVAIYTIWLKGRAGQGGGVPAIQGPGDITFKVATTDTGSHNGLLRGIAVEYVGKSSRPIGLDLTMPPKATNNVGNSGAAFSATLRFGRVLPSGSGEGPYPQHIERAWNGDPYGDWSIKESKELTDVGAEDIAIHLWIAYQ